MLRLPPCRIVITKEEMEQSRQWTQQTYLGRPLSAPSSVHLVLRPGPQRSRDASIVSGDTSLPLPMSTEVGCESKSDVLSMAGNGPPPSCDRQSQVDPEDGGSISGMPPSSASRTLDEDHADDVNMSEHTLLSRALSASDGDPFSIVGDCSISHFPDHLTSSPSRNAPRHVVEHFNASSLSHMSPLDDLAGRFHQLASQTPADHTLTKQSSISPACGSNKLLTGNAFYAEDISDHGSVNFMVSKQYSRKRASPSDAYVTPSATRRPVHQHQAIATPQRYSRTDGTDDSILRQPPSTSMLVGSERYPASTCSPLPDFDALAAQDTHLSCATTPARKAPRYRRSPRGPRPVVSVYDDNLPAEVQANTPADLRYMNPIARGLTRSATGHAISPTLSSFGQMGMGPTTTDRRMVGPPGSRSGPLRESASAHVLSFPSQDSYRRLSRRRDGTPTTFIRHTYSQQNSGSRFPMATPRRCRHVSIDQENEFDPIALGMESELHNWRESQVSEGARIEALGDTPPRRGRYDRYLE